MSRLRRICPARVTDAFQLSVSQVSCLRVVILATALSSDYWCTTGLSQWLFGGKLDRVLLFWMDSFNLPDCCSVTLHFRGGARIFNVAIAISIAHNFNTIGLSAITPAARTELLSKPTGNGSPPGQLFRYLLST